MPSFLASHPARPREKRQSKIDDLKKWAAAFRAPPSVATTSAAPVAPAGKTVPAVATTAPIASAPTANGDEKKIGTTNDTKAKIEDLKKWGASFRAKPQKEVGSAEGATNGSSDVGGARGLPGGASSKPAADGASGTSPLKRTSSFLKRPSIVSLASFKDAAKAATERRKTKKQSEASAAPNQAYSPSGPETGGVVLPHTLNAMDEWSDDSDRAGYGRKRADTSQMEGNEPRGSLDELDPELVELIRIGRESKRLDDEDDADGVAAIASESLDSVADEPDEVEVEIATILQRLIEERSAIMEVLQAEPQESDLEAALATATRLMARQQELDNEMAFLAEELEKRRMQRGQPPIAIPDDRRVSYTHAL